jgi:hypothetical protein
MGICRSGTISGYNEYLNGIRADKESEYSVTLIQFDSPGDNPELTVSYTDKPLADVPELDSNGYEPRGGTPLFDAIGECIRRVEAKDRGVFTVIITDGHENASHEFNCESIKKLIGEKEAEGWKFIFLGANIDSAAVGSSMGIAVQDCANYSVGNEHALYSNVSASTMRYAGAVRSFGTMSAQARSAPQMTTAERSAMGGRPSVPPKFRPPAPKSPTKPAEKPKRDWQVRS